MIHRHGLQRRAARRRGDDAVAFVLEPHAHETHQLIGVVHDEHTCARAICAAARTGGEQHHPDAITFRALVESTSILVTRGDCWVATTRTAYVHITTAPGPSMHQDATAEPCEGWGIR